MSQRQSDFDFRILFCASVTFRIEENQKKTGDFLSQQDSDFDCCVPFLATVTLISKNKAYVSLYHTRKRL